MNALFRESHRDHISATARLLLMLWVVLLVGYLLISLLSASCLRIECVCTREFIDGMRQSALRAITFYLNSFLFVFVLFEVFRPVGLLQPLISKLCCPLWHLMDVTAPPPKLSV
jgi:spore maturation protein SpmB